MNRVAPVFSAPRRTGLVLLTANGVAQGVLAALGAELAGHAFGTDAYSLPVLLAGFAAIATVISGLKVYELASAERLGQQYAIEARMKLFRHLFVADPVATDKLSRGVLMLRFVTDLNGLRLWASLGIARLLAGLATLVAALAMLAWRAPDLAAAAATALVISLIFLALASPLLRTAERALRKQRGRLASNAHKRLSDLEALRENGQAAEKAARALHARSESVAAAAIARARLRGGVRSIGELGAWAALGGVIWSARGQIETGTISLPEVIGAVALAGLLTAPLAAIVRAIEYRHGYIVAREKIDRVLALPPASVAASSFSTRRDDDNDDE